MPDADTGRGRALDPATCRQLLGTVTVGRIAFNDEPSPTVLPVNYLLFGDAVVFRTAEGSKLDAADAASPASFEVDGVDAAHDAGWSVLVRGTLEEMEEPDEELLAAADRIRPLVGGSRPYLVRLTIEELTGRRILPDPAWLDARTDRNTWTDRDASDLLG